MYGVAITDQSQEGFLEIDLIDILCLLGSLVKNSEWELSGVECAGGNAADDLHRLSDSSARVPGRSLLRLAADVTQIIDGLFKGYRNGENHPWIVVRAVDSSAYDVESEDKEVLARVRKYFRNVTDLP